MTQRFRSMMAVVLMSAAVWHLGGCQALTQGSSLQTGFSEIVKEVVAPAVTKAGEELSARSAQLTGQVSAINPGYKVTGYAIFGTGMVYDLNVNAVGLSANVAGAAQADQGPDLTRRGHSGPDGPAEPDGPVGPGEPG